MYGYIASPLEIILGGVTQPETFDDPIGLWWMLFVLEIDASFIKDKQLLSLVSLTSSA